MGNKQSQGSVGVEHDLPVECTSYVVVCGIDFGTTYSGYAFGFTSEPEKFFMNNNWGENLNNCSYKTPTCVLTGPDDEFVAFGYEAEEEYERFETEAERQGHHLYRHFKMSLMKEDLKRSTELVAIDGYRMSALKIFAYAIQYLKDHILEALRKQVNGDPDASRIKWVITVPAIWNDAAKQFMREAAFKAGCTHSVSSPKLVLALEPEAASIYSKDLPVNSFVADRKGGSVGFKDGTVYLIVDAGGGTTDITVHRKTVNNSMEEVFQPSGDAWGSTQIDENFEQLLRKVLGNDFISYLKMHCPLQWLLLLLKFEKAKKSISSDKRETYKVEMSYYLFELFKNRCNRDIVEVIKEKHSLGVCFSQGYLIITHEMALELVMPVVKKVADHITILLQEESLKQVSHLLLVGGLGQSPVLKAELENVVAPHGINVIVPHEAQLAVMRGAVTYGHNIKAIARRIMKHTYGVDMEPRFDIKKYRLNKKIIKEGKEYCADVFQVYVTKGESKETGEAITKKFFPRISDQGSMSFDIFYTDKARLDEVEYVDSEHFKRVGGLTVMMPNARGGMKREVQVEFFFGGTEITVKATDMTSGKTAEIFVNMLWD